MRRIIGMALATLAATAWTARADVWDAGDNEQQLSQNELIHGSDQWHDLSGQNSGTDPDVDWYRIGQSPYSSYEIVVDSTSSALQPGLQLERIGPSGTQPAIPTSSLGSSLRLGWENPSDTSVVADSIRVSAAACSSWCTTGDVYRIRAYETTYSIPRFNNSGTQVTHLMIQNPRVYTITGTVWFWTGGVKPALGHQFTLTAKRLLVLPTASLLPNQAGSITLTHDGGYGALTGKAVALEPATGYTFDTPMVPLIK